MEDGKVLTKVCKFCGFEKAIFDMCFQKNFCKDCMNKKKRQQYVKYHGAIGKGWKELNNSGRFARYIP